MTTYWRSWSWLLRSADKATKRVRFPDARDLRDAFAANPRRLRHAKGISQEDLAYESGVNRTYLSKLEKAATYPGLEIIAKLATVLECDPAELLRVPLAPRSTSPIVSWDALRPWLVPWP
jgi:predicted transcriptional regulator